MLSNNNPRVKYLHRLGSRRFREREGMFLVEGVRFVEEAFASSFHLEMLAYSGKAMENDRCLDLLEDAAVRGVPCFEVEQRLFNELAETVTPQGIVAVARRRWERLIDIKKTAGSWLLVVADGIQDPGNLGTIVRSADAAGADGVILLEGTADIFNPKTLRATMGSVFHIPIIQDVTFPEIREFLRAEGIKLIAAVPRKGQAVYDCSMTGDCAILTGGEAAGPQSETLLAAAEYVHIPMPGQAESLNVAVSAGILLFEAVRQRRG